MNAQTHLTARCVLTCHDSERMSKPLSILSWLCRLTAAGILLQTLYFKFSGAEESVYIFSKLGLEPWGRLGIGLAELVTAILLLLPGTVAIGAALAAGLMLGAIASHLTRLGIVVRDDGGLLFGLAWIMFVCAGVTGFLHRRQLLTLTPAFLRFPL